MTIRSASLRAWFFALLALSFVACESSPVAKPAKPNLVLVSVDTLRADHLGCYGFSRSTSPNVDRLASRGVRFEHAYSTVPLTTPSHSTMFTGLYPPATGVRLNGYEALPPDRTTLAELLREAGYATAAFVGGFPLDASFALDQGFDVYDDDLADADRTNPGIADRRAEVVVDRALAWLSRQDGGRPFFLFVHLFDPHAPYQPPEPFATRYADDLYSGEVAYADAQLGRLFDALGARDQLAGTVIAFVSDHGESLGEHGEDIHGIFIYDATMHVPMVFAGAGIPAGRVESAPAALVDLLPTLATLAGVSSLPSPIHGADLGGAWNGAGAPADRALYAESMRPRTPFDWAPLRSIRRGQTKYILAPREELYDLASDPKETANRFGENAERDADMRRLLKKREAEITPPGGGKSRQLELDAAAIAKLQSLGYVTGPSSRGDEVDPLSLPDPKDRIAVVNGHALAQTHEAEGRADQAAVIYGQLLATYPEEHWLRVRLAEVLLKGGRREDVLEVLSPARLGGLPVVQLLKAMAFRAGALGELGRFDEALAEWDALEALGEAGLESALHGKVGLLGALVGAGHVDVALPALERSVETHTTSVELARILGDARLANGRGDDALAAYRRAESLARPDAAAEDHEREARVRAARRVLEHGDRKGAAIFVVPLASTAPGERTPASSELLWRLADVLPIADAALFSETRAMMARGDYSGVERRLKAAAVAPELEAVRLFELGEASARNGRREEARAALARAIALEPTLTPAVVAYAELLAKDGLAEEAERQYRRALAGSPDDAALHVAVGRFLLGAGRAAEAVPILERALALEPRSIEALLALADALDRLGRSSEARARRQAAEWLRGRR